MTILDKARRLYSGVPEWVHLLIKIFPSAILGIAFYGLMIFMLILPFQSDFAASSIRLISLNGDLEESPLQVVIRIESLNDVANAAQATVIATAKGFLADNIRSGGASFKVVLTDGNPGSSGIEHIATLTLDKTAWSQGSYGLESPAVTASLPMYHSVWPYPFDNYTSYLSISADSAEVSPIPKIKMNIVKMVAGRTVEARGETTNFSVTLVRPRLQQVFIVISGLVFMSIIIGVALRIIRMPTVFNPVNQSITVASFLLGAAGFRDLMGFSKLPSFSVAEAFIVGIPLLLLAFAFFRSAMSKATTTN